MPIRSLGDLFYSFVAWLPILLLVGGFALWIISGMIHFEARTYGTSWFIENDRTINEFKLYNDRRKDNEEMVVAL